MYKVNYIVAQELMHEYVKEIEKPNNLQNDHTFRANHAKNVQYGF